MEENLKIDHDFISTWHPRYDELVKNETEYKALVNLTAKDISDHKTLLKSTFLRMLFWKTPRLKGIVKLNDFDVYKESIRMAYLAKEDEKLFTLLPLNGVGAPFGSTILHFIYPDSFPIFNNQTVETLNYAHHIKFSKTYGSYYALFRTKMLQLLSENQPFTLRELDRALYAYHEIYLSTKFQNDDENNAVISSKGSRFHNTLTIKGKILSVFLDKLGEQFETKTIIDLVVMAFPGTSRDSVIPSDYCYNSINKSPSSFKFRVFESLGNQTYNFLGPDQTYSGPIYWTREKVGEWKQGKYQLWKDPRKLSN